ncbi:DsbA family protein [Streptomyces sp. RG80]|uniref:DsbA family protein n=1 Tax=Streptomyces sp. RG80 TaxID=3157340 RepID=UPI00338ECCA3
MSSTKPIRLTYAFDAFDAFDAYCGWCYGFGPALHEFAAVNADRIELRVLSGGLFTGRRALMDSADAATGLVALRSQPGANALDAAAAMQRAWYVDGRSLSDAAVYRDIATELGLDADAVGAAYVSPAARTEAEADFLQVRRLGVDGYPTLLLHTAHGTDRQGGPVSSADALTRALDQHLAAAAAA